VDIVGKRVTRMSFASSGSVRKGWQRSGRTRIGTTLPMVYLSLVCHCPGVKAVVRRVPAWGNASSRSRGVVLERAVRPAWQGGQTGPAQRGAVGPAWLGSSTTP
jgi:hypothetical protein